MSFQIGVLGGFFAVNEWQVAGIWSCLIPLGLASYAGGSGRRQEDSGEGCRTPHLLRSGQMRLKI